MNLSIFPASMLLLALCETGKSDCSDMQLVKVTFGISVVAVLSTNLHPHPTPTGTAIIQKAQYVRVGPFPMISGVIVKSGGKFRLDPDYKPAPLPFPFLFFFFFLLLLALLALVLTHLYHIITGTRLC